MKLPNSDKALVPIEKLRDYCLSTKHEVGKHKAKVFARDLDLNLGDADFLCGEILRKVTTYDAIHIETNEFGKHYFVDFPIEFRNKSALIRTKWTIRPNEDFPRLTSCYVKKRRKV